jgi:hypothetical protein
LSLILWEEGAEALEGLMLAKKYIILFIYTFHMLLPGFPKEKNETLIYKKRGTHKNNDRMLRRLVGR